MNKASKNLLESFLFKHNEVRSLYDVLELPILSSSEHKEHTNIVSNFDDSYKCVIAIGITVSCFIIKREGNKYHCIEISQEVFYSKYPSAAKLRDNIVKVLKQKDYVPEPIFKKVILVDSLEDRALSGKIFTEVFKNKYTDKPVTLCCVDVFNKDSLLNASKIINEYLRSMEK